MAGKEDDRISVPNNPKALSLVGNRTQVRILKRLLELRKELAERNPTKAPGPYLSMIANTAHLNKRTVLVALNDLESDGYVKSSWVRHMVRGRLTLVKVYEPATDLTWISELKVD